MLAFLGLLLFINSWVRNNNNNCNNREQSLYRSDAARFADLGDSASWSGQLIRNFMSALLFWKDFSKWFGQRKKRHEKRKTNKTTLKKSSCMLLCSVRICSIDVSSHKDTRASTVLASSLKEGSDLGKFVSAICFLMAVSTECSNAS